MAMLVRMIGATAGGAIGWWAGSFFGLFMAFMLCIVGTAVGTYFAIRLGQSLTS
jgi:hypothetical protein